VEFVAFQNYISNLVKQPPNQQWDQWAALCNNTFTPQMRQKLKYVLFAKKISEKKTILLNWIATLTTTSTMDAWTSGLNREIKSAQYVKQE
jgi:hypothetical protein